MPSGPNCTAEAGIRPPGPGLLVAVLGLALLVSTASAQLAGAYSVNQTQPTGGSNYQSLGDAVGALMSQGVAGAVTFDVHDDGGPFTEANPSLVTAWTPATGVLVLGQWPGASATNRVTFRAAPGEHPAFDASGQSMGVYWQGADYVTLEGIEVFGAIYDAVSIYCDATTGQVFDAVISRCCIHDCGSTGVTIYGNSPNPTNTLVEACWFWNLQTGNAGSFSTISRNGYVSSRRQVGTRVVSNTFFVGTGTGMNFCVVGDTPSSPSPVSWAEFSNNIVVKTVAGAAIHRWNAATGATSPSLPAICESNCYHDLSFGGSFAIYGGAGTGNTLVANLADWTAQTGLDTLSFDLDPELVAPADGDLHILATSPCKDSSLSGTFSALDIDGSSRPQGFGPDIGADENLSVGVVPPVVPFQVGGACPGTGGLAPTLGAFGLPALGNAFFRLDAVVVPPAAPVYLFAGLQLAAAPLQLAPGCRFYLDLPGAVAAVQAGLSPLGPVLADATGHSAFALPIPAAVSLAGVSLAFQALVFDGGVPLGLTLTNALTIQIN